MRGRSYSKGVRNVVLRPAEPRVQTTNPYARSKPLALVASGGRSMTVTVQKKKPKRIEGQGAEYTTKKVSYGQRPKNTLKNLTKFVKGNVSRTIFGIHTVSRFGGLQGANILSQVQTAPGAVLAAPLHVYDMTACINTRNGAIITPNNYWVLNFSNETTTATASWVNYGFAGLNMVLEESPNASSIVQNYPGPSSVLRWGQARMVFYAPTALPVKINVSIVQFLDEDLVPDNRTSATTVLNTRSTAWFQGYMKKKMFSPIETEQAGGFKGIKTLHSETFILNPKETTENEATRYKQLDIFKWFNRDCDYLWDQTVQTSDASSVPGLQNGGSQNTVHPKKRIFLMINGQAGLSTVNTATVHPSYDLVIRTQHEQLNA